MPPDLVRTASVNEDALFFKEMIGNTCDDWGCEECKTLGCSVCLMCHLRRITGLDSDKYDGFHSKQELLDFVSWVKTMSAVSPFDYCYDVSCQECEWIKGVEIMGSEVSECPRTKLYHKFG